MTDLTSLILTLQDQNRILNATLSQFMSGVPLNPVPSIYTVAGLPATAANGQWAYASNGRKPGEGAGLGTGVPVFFNAPTVTWFSYCSGAVVAA